MLAKGWCYGLRCYFLFLGYGWNVQVGCSVVWELLVSSCLHFWFSGIWFSWAWVAASVTRMLSMVMCVYWVAINVCVYLGSCCWKVTGFGVGLQVVELHVC